MFTAFAYPVTIPGFSEEPDLIQIPLEFCRDFYKIQNLTFLNNTSKCCYHPRTVLQKQNQHRRKPSNMWCTEKACNILDQVRLEAGGGKGERLVFCLWLLIYNTLCFPFLNISIHFLKALQAVIWQLSDKFWGIKYIYI